MKLSAERISFSYRREQVLDDVSLEVSSGELLGLVGPNGAGKSTLLRCLAGMERVRSGRVCIDDQDVRRLKPRDLARQVAMVPQSGMPVFGLSVDHFVGLGRYAHERFLVGPTDADREIVALCLDQLGLSAFRHRPVHELSGGEFRSVLIAQALAQEAPIMLFDEPIQQLDLEHQMDVMERIRSLATQDGRTGVVVLHELGMAARYCDRIALLHQGRVIACGRPEAVLSPDNLSTVFGVRGSVERHEESGSLQLFALERVQRTK